MKKMFWAYFQTDKSTGSRKELINIEGNESEQFYKWLCDLQEEKNCIIVNCGII